MSRQFMINIENEDLSETDVYMAIENYSDELLKDGEISEVLQFEVVTMD